MDNKVSHDEFDYLMELIASILFMTIGIFGVVFMITQFNRQVELNPRVDKVRVSSIDQEDRDPFYFTAYQAYMFAYMMDGHDKTALYWFSTLPENPNVGGAGTVKEAPSGSTFPGDGYYIGLCPAELANGFVVVRNRAIIGSQDYGGKSVKLTLSRANGNNENEVANDYRGLNGKRWHLCLTDTYVDYETEEYADAAHLNLFEKRKDYLWSLHPCSLSSP